MSVNWKVILQTYLFEPIERGYHMKQDSKIRPHFFLWLSTYIPEMIGNFLPSLSLVFSYFYESGRGLPILVYHRERIKPFHCCYKALVRNPSEFNFICPEAEILNIQFR